VVEREGGREKVGEMRREKRGIVEEIIAVVVVGGCDTVLSTHFSCV
jgi:hypothetical protein